MGLPTAITLEAASLESILFDRPSKGEAHLPMMSSSTKTTLTPACQMQNVMQRGGRNVFHQQEACQYTFLLQRSWPSINSCALHPATCCSASNSYSIGRFTLPHSSPVFHWLQKDICAITSKTAAFHHTVRLGQVSFNSLWQLT